MLRRRSSGEARAPTRRQWSELVTLCSFCFALFDLALWRLLQRCHVGAPSQEALLSTRAGNAEDGFFYHVVVAEALVCAGRRQRQQSVEEAVVFLCTSSKTNCTTHRRTSSVLSTSRKIARRPRLQNGGSSRSSECLSGDARQRISSVHPSNRPDRSSNLD